MVFEKRLDYYGFNGYWAPAVPRASRSARRKRSFRMKTEGNQLYAFDLLATVAGELSLLKESSVPSSDRSPGRAENVAAKDTAKSESRDEEKPFKYDPCGKGGSLESASVTEVGLHQHDADYSLKGCLRAQDDVTLLSTSMKVKFESSEKVNHADQSLPGKVKDDPIQGICHTESHSPGIAESHDSKVDIAIKEQLKVGKQVIGDTINGTAPDIFMTEDPKELDVNTPKLVNSDSSIGAPLCGDHISSGLLLRCQDDVKIVVSRDDDENSSRCTQPGTIPLKAFRPPHLGNRRIRKLLTSKVSRVAPRLLKDGKRYNKDFETKPIFRGKESCYTRQRTQRCSPFKRRKLFGRSSASMFEGGVGSGSVSISPGKGNNGAVGYGASRVSTPVAGRESSFKCDDSRVKLSIKSFRVPELFIEIPETATVGSLKRTVVEAVTAILGGGLRVGVLLQGKKVRDDNRTLLQTGIARDDKLETLGFMLEPNPPDPLPSLCPESRNLLLPCDAAGPPTRYPVPIPDPVPPQNLPLTNADNCNKSGPNSVPCHADMSLEKERPNSRALVAIPTMSVEALTVVPLPRKSRRSELVQRRIRRPFSVSEVEALVQAVEKLGTGRWRDVKIRAFENAKHRTYVDLKDKWKTLVHTARISPQQRRGEPVPQELLNRVLSAHAYWSQQQSKDHIKLQAEPSYL